MFTITTKQWNYIISMLTMSNLQTALFCSHVIIMLFGKQLGKPQKRKIQKLLSLIQLSLYVISNLNGPVNTPGHMGQQYGRGRQIIGYNNNFNHYSRRG
eukprot:Pgem_evm1s7208